MYCGQKQSSSGIDRKENVFITFDEMMKNVGEILRQLDSATEDFLDISQDVFQQLRALAIITPI